MSKGSDPYSRLNDQHICEFYKKNNMKLTINTTIIGAIVLLVGLNITLFMHGITLSDEINYYESELTSIEQENIDYEQEIYKLESYTLTASHAAELKFGKYNEPIYGDVPAYALK